MKHQELSDTRSVRCRVVPAASILLATLLCPSPDAEGRELEPGDIVGDFRLRDIRGSEVDSADWLDTPEVWLFVSATQKSSEAAIRELQKVVDELPGARVRAAVLTGQSEQISYFREFSERYDIRVPVVLDDRREVYGRVGVIVLPTTVLVDRRGRLHHILPGHPLDYGRRLRAHLAFLTGRIDADGLRRSLETKESLRNRARERAERLCQSAEFLLRRRLVEEAETELRRAIEADPDYGSAYLRLAELTATRGDFDEAERLVGTVEQREPENHQTKLTLGTIRLRQGRLADSEALLKEAFILNPDPVRTNYWLGRLYEKRGMPGKAAVHYRAAVERLLPELYDGAMPSPGTGR